jgi:rod shape-determining protein MreD
MTAGSPINGAFVARMAVLTLLAVIVQTCVLGQFPVFGVTGELSPLVVAFVGMLCGAVEGAVVGFAVGLFVDLALVQTVGVSSLIYTIIGYGAGRLREMRVRARISVDLPAFV